MFKNKLFVFSAIFPLLLFLFGSTSAQTRPNQSQKVRTVTIPISILTKQELKGMQTEEFVQADRLSVKENNDEQTILSIRSLTNAPLALAILVQDDLTSNFNLQLRDISNFIRKLPRGSRVMVAYLRGGSTQVRQRFTDDLEKAADSLRIAVGSASIAPRSPYEGIEDVLNRFDALPTGRRAILLISDGLDTSNGLDFSSLNQSIDLDNAILKAQRRSVAVYSFYSPTTLTENGNSRLILSGQSSLEKISKETGGRAFFQGSIAPISFEPFFRDLNLLLNRQFVLTYLSTHPKKGYYKIQVSSTNPEVTIEHPKGYYFR
ncbi:MAG: putative chloride channel protein [Acidobacteria bacterium]|jgi:VWFA-related protein|nr:putative chloride channel protein [Acidobacteriota bacterium]